MAVNNTNNTGGISKPYRINSANETALNALSKKVSGPDNVDLRDKVMISGRAQLIKDIREIVDQSPEVREQKIMEARQQIENNNYSPDIDAIVDKLLNADFAVKI